MSDERVENAIRLAVYLAVDKGGDTSIYIYIYSNIRRVGAVR